MSVKSTNRGTCQCCGSIQNLPAAVLAKHGYTRRWGFFSGTCRGSGHQPFELSKNLIDAFIATAQAQIVELEALKMQLLARPADATKAWVRVYRVGNGNRRSGYYWMELPLAFAERETASGRKWLEVSYRHPDAGWALAARAAAGLGDPLEYIQDLNRKYAADVEEKQIRQIAQYVTWQQGRIAEWSVRPLLPLLEASTPG